MLTIYKKTTQYETLGWILSARQVYSVVLYLKMQEKFSYLIQGNEKYIHFGM